MTKKKDLDLLIKGGKVFDPISGLEGLYDIGIRGERIARIEERIPRSEAASTLEAKGTGSFPVSSISIATSFGPAPWSVWNRILWPGVPVS